MTLAPFPFVVGAGRSGNTLLRLMLDSHPQIAIPPESDFLVAASAAKSAEELYATTALHWRIRDWQIDVARFADRLRALHTFDAAAGIRALYAVYAEKFGKPRYGDKTPFYLANLATIARALPEAHFIHIIRDGRDAALSIKDLWFGPNTLSEAAAWWQEQIRTGRQQAQAAAEGRYLEVRYEDLLADPERILRRVCDFIALDFDAAMLRYHERAAARVREVITDFRRDDGELIASVAERHHIHRRLLTPPDHSRAGVWRTALTAEENEAFIASAGATLGGLGYPLR